MKRKQKNNYNKDDTMRLYRKCNDFLLLKKEELKNANDEDIFRIAIEYEFAHLTKMINYIFILKEGRDSSPPIYYRMCLELNAIYQLYVYNRLDQTNFQLFKIQGNSRDIGEKERKKLSRKLGIPEKVFSRVIQLNRPFYLIGAVKNHERFRNIVIESYSEKYHKSPKVVETIKRLYDFLGIQAHIAMDWMNFCALDDEFIASLGIFVLTFEMYYKKELKQIKQIKTKPLIFNEAKNEDVQLIHDKITIFMQNVFDFFEELFDQPEYSLEQFYEGLSFAAQMIKTLIISYTEGIVYSLMPLLKVIYEKCGIIYETLLGSREERHRKAKRFEYSFWYSFKKAELNDKAYDDEEIEQLYKECVEFYEEDKKVLNNVSKDAYLNKIQTSPLFAVFLKDKGFSEIANEIIEIVDPEDKEELFVSYIHGVENSHSSGFSIFKNDDEFRVDILYTIKFLIMYTSHVLKLLKIVLKDEKIKSKFYYTNYDLNVFNESADPFVYETNTNFVEDLESDLRILQNTFLNHYRDDVEKYIIKSRKPTEDEISDVSLQNDNFN